MRFVLYLQPGKELFPKDAQGNVLTSKITFLDAWEVGSSFTVRWRLCHYGMKRPHALCVILSLLSSSSSYPFFNMFGFRVHLASFTYFF